MEQFLGKKYKLTHSENFEEFMKALGVGFATRKAGSLVSPVVELTKSGESYTFTSNSTFKKIEFTFKNGEEFDQETPDGRMVKSTIKVDGNTLHEIQKDAKGEQTVIDRIFSDDELKMELKFGNVSATRVYKIHA
ncbi:fatty acid-binding protein, muscle-like [Photinus pyralis]|uniref:Fatty acid-binding protein, muscle n=1 Tax=Photinus pyralis TaxID=7054 RepID=A0A1Y1NDG9_PHOPY|nr:fatty acid-binding protein, muscle-like [Photinus pyralis]